MKSLICTIVCVLVYTCSANAKIIILDDKKKAKVETSNSLSHIAPFHKVTFHSTVSIRNTQAQIACLAVNIYFEARSEGIPGRLSVAHVTMNRVKSTHYPDDVCEVVTQPWQFSWYNSEKIKIISEKKAWEEALFLARAAYTNYIEDPTSGALYYHRADISPEWSNRVAYITTIGKHKFYN